MSQDLQNFTALKEGLYQDFEESILREKKPLTREVLGPAEPETKTARQEEVFEEDEDD